MIITDIKRLREIPAGKRVTLVLELQAVRADIDNTDQCCGCVFSDSGCNYCSAKERLDRDEVKFIKI
jgi:hypothetical protein